ncbi:hypothetical protein AMTRI_Chr10g4180 [Amborella trichopoda]
MLWSFMAQCMIWVKHSSCKYDSSRAISRAIHVGFMWLECVMKNIYYSGI